MASICPTDRLKIQKSCQSRITFEDQLNVGLFGSDANKLSYRSAQASVSTELHQPLLSGILQLANLALPSVLLANHSIYY